MSEVTRDVTVRVHVAGGKIDKLPDFDKAATAADTFFNRVNAGFQEWQDQSSRAVGTTLAMAEQLKAVGQINIAPAGLENLEHAVEAIAVRQQQAGEAASSSAATQAASAETVEQAQDQVTQSLFKTIAVSERLGAHRRAQAAETKQQEAEKAAAIARGGAESQKQMLAAAGSIGQAMAAGASFVKTLQMLSGNDEDVEALAKSFAEVQATFTGLAAGTQLFSNLNAGLTAVQASAAAASTSLAASGASATFAQGAMIRLAPAAVAAQAALGPIAIAIGAIALVATAAKAAMDFFGDDVPDDAARSSAALDEVERRLEKIKRRVEQTANSIRMQNDLLLQELDIRKTIDGYVTGGDIAAASAAASSSAEADFKAKLETASAEAEAKRKRNQAEASEADRSAKEAYSRGDTATFMTEMDRWGELTAEQYQMDDAASQHQKIASMGVSLDNADKVAAEIEKLPAAQRQVYRDALKEFLSEQARIAQDADSRTKSQVSDYDAQLRENESQQRSATEAYESERDIALRLQADPADVMRRQNQIDAAGPSLAGIDALSGAISGDRESELRESLAQGTLTTQELRAELADATEFESEQEQLSQQIAELKAQQDKIAGLKDELVKGQKAVTDRLSELQDEIRQVQSATQAR